MISIAVVGLGTIGTLFTSHLIAACRHKVIACVRSPVDRLRVEGDYGLIEAVPDCLTDPALATPVDFVFLATKSQETAGAADWLKRLCAEGTRVAVLQNGVDHEQRVAPFCGPAVVVPTVVYANGRKVAPHYIRHLCPGDDLMVPASDAGRAVASLFDASLLRVRPSRDFVTDSWQKYLANLVANPLTSLTNRNIEVVRGSEMEQLALGILREAAQVGRAMGAKLPDDAAEQTLRWMSRYPGDTGTSMLQDRKDGKPMEIEALTGTLVRLGEELHIPTPLNRAVRALLMSIH
jgi:2-dehydropantoate 2-reductase